MKETLQRVRQNIQTLGWAFSIAWKIDHKVLLIWYGVSILLSILPALALQYQEKIIMFISAYLSFGSGAFNQAIPTILTFGLILVAIGLSTRVNKDLIYLIMYDSYYVGMQSMIIEHARYVDIESLQDKDTMNSYISTALRAASLTDFMSATCALLGKVISIISLLIVAINSSYIVFGISLVYLVAIIVLNHNYIEKIRKDERVIREQNNRAHYYEKLPLNLSVAKEIRLYNNKEDIIKQWESAYLDVMNFERQFIFSSEKRAFVSGVSFYLFMIIMIGSSIFEAYYSHITPASVLTLFTLCTNMFTAISGLASEMMSAYDGLYFLGLQRNMLSTVPPTYKQSGNEGLSKEENIIIKARNISFQYKSGITALNNVSFDIKKGEIIALVGENGSGKTTLVKLLLGIYAPQSGHLFFMGKPLELQNMQDIAKQIGVYFQGSIMLHKSLRDNVGYGDVSCIDDNEKIMDALNKGGALDIVKRLPQGVNTTIGKQADKTGVDLSGGEKQRIGIARAHMSNKELLIMDEPAAALDPIAEVNQFMTLKKTLQGRSAVLISHRIGFARLADKIIVLKNGKIDDIGTHEELIKRDGVYSSMFKAQSKWYQTETEVPYE